MSFCLEWYIKVPYKPIKAIVFPTYITNNFNIYHISKLSAFCFLPCYPVEIFNGEKGAETTAISQCNTAICAVSYGPFQYISPFLFYSIYASLLPILFHGRNITQQSKECIGYLG